MNFFKPEDFQGQILINDKYFDLNEDHREEFAKKTNRLLQERGAPVFGTFVIGKGYRDFSTAGLGSEQDTHWGLLICIEKLPKKECVHEPGSQTLLGDDVLIIGKSTRLKCKHCGVELEFIVRAKE